MHQERMTLHKIVALHVLLFCVLSAVCPSISTAFILDRKDGLSYCPGENADNNKQKVDISCLNDEHYDVLKLSKQEVAGKVKAMNIDHVIDLYLCAWQARLEDQWQAVAEYVFDNVPVNLDYLMHRLELESDDDRVAVLLVIFAFYGFDYYFNKMKTGQDSPAYDDLIFSGDKARFLVAKAEAIKDCGQRNFLLDYLIPLLPYDEAMAKQEKREEEARKQSGK
ncbi:hypothetical protein [Fundidesulfovibrio terrae]|uniref:hypothetical protein n=1 Tax=Fundidesulfovibrio terrae TaxID=2922866 RepID=UPI001FAE8BEC|nr:hypothetical protein [Fundidesulfovibrio terrae]